jgi:hypothetical protein
MEFVHGLDIKAYDINEILKIAYSKGFYIDNYPKFKVEYDYFLFNKKTNEMEFYFKKSNNCLKIKMELFVDYYIEFLNRQEKN